MADAYGMMVLRQSKDLVCDFDKLIESLNNFEWNNSQVGWKKGEYWGGDTMVHMDCDGYSKVQYPSVFPDEFKGIILKDDDGTERFIENPTKEEFDDHWDLIYEATSIERLARELSKNIQHGEIEISCVSNEKQRYVHMERLIIRSDGSAFRSLTRIGHEYNDEFSEEFSNKEAKQ